METEGEVAPTLDGSECPKERAFALIHDDTKLMHDEPTKMKKTGALKGMVEMETWSAIRCDRASWSW